jgi:hypothetical protein
LSVLDEFGEELMTTMHLCTYAASNFKCSGILPDPYLANSLTVMIERSLQEKLADL